MTDEGGNTAVRPLSVEAEEFSLGSGPKNRVTAGAGSDGRRDFLPSRTGPGGIVIRCDAVVLTAAEAGAAALADIAGAVAPVDFAGTNVPAVAGMKFSAVAEVHSSDIDDEGDPSVVRTSRQRSAVILDPMAAPRKDGGPMEEISVLEPLEHSVLEVSLEGGDSLLVDVAMPDPLEHSGVGRAADVVLELLVAEPLEHSVLVVSLEVGNGLVDNMAVLDPLEHAGVGVRAEPVSAYLPRVYSEESRNGRGGLRDHRGEDLWWDGMVCWVRKPLQSCLPHQLDLRTGQLWAEGRATLQLHQQRLIPDVQGFLMTSVVLPPDSEIVAPFSVSGVRLGSCALVEPSRSLTEEYGVVVGHTLVDASSWSTSVLMINPNTEEVVLLSFTCVGKLVPVLAVSDDGCVALPDHLEEIVMGSHPLLGEADRRLLRELLHRYKHVFPAPGEPVTGRTTSVSACVQEMLLGGQIEPSDSLWASPVVLVTKKDGSMRLCGLPPVEFADD